MVIPRDRVRRAPDKCIGEYCPGSRENYVQIPPHISGVGQAKNCRTDPSTRSARWLSPSDEEKLDKIERANRISSKSRDKFGDELLRVSYCWLVRPSGISGVGQLPTKTRHSFTA